MLAKLPLALESRPVPQALVLNDRFIRPAIERSTWRRMPDGIKWVSLRCYKRNSRACSRCRCSRCRSRRQEQTAGIRSVQSTKHKVQNPKPKTQTAPYQVPTPTVNYMPAPKTEPDALGHWGPYGGRFVPETLMAPLEGLTEAYLVAKDDPDFQAELAGLLRDYAG